MKNRWFVFLCLVGVFSFSSCALVFNASSSSADGSSSSTDGSSTVSSGSVSSSSASDGTSSASASSSESGSSAESVSSTSQSVDFFSYPESVVAAPDEKTITLSDSNYGSIGSYSTGNFSNQYSDSEITEVSGISFEHYRAARCSDGDGFITLLPFQANPEDGTIPGALYNVTKINEITQLYLSFRNADETKTGFSLAFSSDNKSFQRETAKAVKAYALIKATLPSASYFKILAVDQAISIASITICYRGNSSSAANDYRQSGEGEYRINPVTVSGNLVAGSSQVEVPTSFLAHSDGMYSILSTKTYVYYTFDYVLAHPEIKSSAALTDPLDVARYCVAFKSWPANYVFSSSTSKGFSLFGKSVRCVSLYSRTDGYVNALPVDTSGDFNYCELDIDIGNTYITDSGSITRGVGRVVVFMSNGLSNPNYDSSPVAVYTDDHYATFQEYLILGAFGERFNVQCSNRLPFIWGAATTLVSPSATRR
jgi:hypothetical protein